MHTSNCCYLCFLWQQINFYHSLQVTERWKGMLCSLGKCVEAWNHLDPKIPAAYQLTLSATHERRVRVRETETKNSITGMLKVTLCKSCTDFCKVGLRCFILKFFNHPITFVRPSLYKILIYPLCWISHFCWCWCCMCVFFYLKAANMLQYVYIYIYVYICLWHCKVSS